MKQQHNSEPDNIRNQIRGIEELIASHCWLVLSPRQKENWRRQLNSLRCRQVFISAYPDFHQACSAPELEPFLVQGSW